ncbi:MAG: STM4012 family radical SAM protein [Gemmataceae bacterium]|nr:STM4012 family radical SAM protein [Gemmataceae bacterium]
MTDPRTLLTGSPYVGYAYAYPHKTAYRPLRPPVPLSQAWAGEDRGALFLYVHVPFCEMRCAFCNLFTRANPREDLTSRYLDALARQAERVRAAIPDARFVRFAVGGGTPTFLDVEGLETVFRVARATGAELGGLPVSVETSPGTAEPEKLALLRAHGVTRVSLGVQSFLEGETAAIARPQPADVLESALQRLRAARFPTLNLDLIYGLPGQTVNSWLASVHAALAYSPEEIYLYPLYVRALTGLGRAQASWDDVRLTCYREARALLLERGYVQVSMRMFRTAHAPADEGPVYCCQEDGMIGLGCGARSYTRGLHYSSEYAVQVRGVAAIIEDYVSRPAEAFDRADHGFVLDSDEQRRRYLIQSLLQADGLARADYTSRFGTNAVEDFPQLRELEALGLATLTADRMRLTESGLERSDAIGPWLYSERVTRLTEEYTWR